MSETTKIEWATSTGNPWIGCTKVSPGCKNCYAAELDEKRFSKTMGGGTKENPVSHWGKGAPRFRTKAFWTDARKWNERANKWHCEKCGTTVNDPEQLGNPFACPNCNYVLTPLRQRIFPSLCDWLDDEVPIEWLADFLKLIRDTPNLDWLLLTKRPELMEARVNAALKLFDAGNALWTLGGLVPHNVWIGVSVEDQQRAEERIPVLLKIPAKVRFLSVEPLLERVDLSRWLWQLPDPICTNCPKDVDCVCGFRTAKENGRTVFDWVIVGGESGPGRRDCGAEAIIDVANQCVATSVPVFVKQDSHFKPGQQGRIPPEIWKLKQFPNV